MRLGPDRPSGALLLAAGLGTRLSPLTDVLPKCLAPIRGRPLLDYWLGPLVDAGIGPIVLNTHYLADCVADYVTNGRFAPFVTLTHEAELLGTGGTLIANAKRFEPGPLLVAHADNLSSFDIRAFFAAHAVRPAGSVMTMMTFTTDDPRSCGIVSTDARGLVDGFFEKVADPPGDHANAAVYIVEAEVIRFVEGLGSRIVDLSTEVLPHFVGRMSTWHNDVYHRDIGNLAAWRTAQHEFPGPVPEVSAADDPWTEWLAGRACEIRETIERLLSEEGDR